MRRTRHGTPPAKKNAFFCVYSGLPKGHEASQFFPIPHNIFPKKPKTGMKFEKFCKLYAKDIKSLRRFNLFECFSIHQYAEALLLMAG